MSLSARHGTPAWDKEYVAKVETSQVEMRTTGTIQCGDLRSLVRYMPKHLGINIYRVQVRHGLCSIHTLPLCNQVTAHVPLPLTALSKYTSYCGTLL